MAASHPGPAGGTVYRPGRIRALGPIVVLALPVSLCLLAALIIRTFPCDGTACGKPYLGAWGLVLVALPTALATGLPWVVSPINLALALITSVAAWVTFGRWASRRATQDVDASWWSFWREIAFYAGGIVLGLLGGTILMVIILTVI